MEPLQTVTRSGARNVRQTATKTKASERVQLSAQQRQILSNALKLTRETEQISPSLLKSGIPWNLQWSPQSRDKDIDRSLENVWRASMCRALARLERRGLISRIKGRKKARTTSVLLTDQGRKIAESFETY